MTTSTTYVRYELLRTFRNLRFFIFSLIFPLILFYVVAGAQRNTHLNGLPFPTYYMAGMVSWGTMAAVMAGGVRIAAERQVGWNRQMRITPLSVRTYFATKVGSGYAMASVSIVLLFAAGLTLGVRMPELVDWFELAALVLIGLIPFAVLGVLLGHVLTVDSMGPALGGSVTLFALLGGAWGPVANSSGVLKQLCQLLPSYWLVQAGQVALGGKAWPPKAWIVIAVWTVVLVRITVRVYNRDTKRI
jgi:ABC-2 type transport system permease protein